MAFVKAERRKAKIKIALTGPSGSGKTYSALSLAKGMLSPGKKIALIDTENHSAALYADEFDFDCNAINPPYEVDKYIKAIDEAVKAGYEVLVIDSITHAWAAEGGLLDKKQALDARGGNSYTNWAGITKEQNAFVGKLLSCPIHLIVTMRSKQEYVMETNDKGKQVPKKVGMAPVQRDGMEYEFTASLDLAMDHLAQSSKDRTKIFDGRFTKLTTDVGEQLIAWLNTAKEELYEGKADQKVQLVKWFEQLGLSKDKWAEAAELCNGGLMNLEAVRANVVSFLGQKDLPLTA